MKPTRAQRDFLERLAKGPKLRVAVEGSGRTRVPRDVVARGWAVIGEDPHVKDPWGYPADAYIITPSGYLAIGKQAS